MTEGTAPQISKEVEDENTLPSTFWCVTAVPTGWTLLLASSQAFLQFVALFFGRLPGHSSPSHLRFDECGRLVEGSVRWARERGGVNK